MANGAFGTYKGMTKEELKNKGVVFKKENIDRSFISNDAPIKNNFIENYQYYFDVNGGLCAIKGVNTPKIDKNYDNADQVRETYESLEKALINKYGKPSIEINNIKNKYNNNWFYGSIKNNKTRFYTVNFDKPKEFFKQWEVKDKFSIALFPILLRPFDNTDKGIGTVILMYSFPNCVSQKADSSRGL